MRNLIVCCDGTGNTPEQVTNQVPVPTNVVRLFNALAEKDQAGNEQVKYYHSGVGTEGSGWARLWGLSVGDGLDRNIRSAYNWLAHEYRAGDRIFLFGFSRGAFTAHCLAHMIDRCGLLDFHVRNNDEWGIINRLYEQGYKTGGLPESLWQRHVFHADQQPGQSRIYFLGVWDIVAALGMPDYLWFFNLLDQSANYNCHSTDLCRNVLIARHALALDERRNSFTPLIWNNTFNSAQDVVQLWFPGAHSDVGGGYLEKGLSDGALQWMLEQVYKTGLEFTPPLNALIGVQIHSDPLGYIHDSYSTGPFKYLRWQPRRIPLMNQNSPELHSSALKRLETPLLDGGDYFHTTALDLRKRVRVIVYAGKEWNWTGIYLRRGFRCRIRAQGQWIWDKIWFYPNGKMSIGLGRQPIRFLLLKIINRWACLGRLVLRNNAIDSHGWGVRNGNYRHMALLGATANCDNPGLDGTPRPHEIFSVGYNTNFSPKNGDGYLYLFGNGCWQRYSNYHGFLAVSIQLLWDREIVYRAGDAAVIRKVYTNERWSPTGIYLEAGSYTISARGRWLDRTIKCDPDGILPPGRPVFAQHLVEWLGVVERLVKIVGARKPFTRFARRDRRQPWCILLGAIVATPVVDENEAVPLQTFAIGTGVKIEVSVSGYLYCYVNDAWDFYCNNRGFLRVTVN